MYSMLIIYKIYFFGVLERWLYNTIGRLHAVFFLYNNNEVLV